MPEDGSFANLHLWALKQVTLTDAYTVSTNEKLMRCADLAVSLNLMGGSKAPGQMQLEGGGKRCMFGRRGIMLCS